MERSPALPRPATPPAVVAVEMGYGHLRAARSLADALGSSVRLADRAPLAGPEEQRLWRASRRFYEVASRCSQVPVAGAPLGALLDALTSIPPLYPYRDLSTPTLQARSLDRLVRKGLGAGLGDRLGREVTVLVEDGLDAYLTRFNALLAETDLLWTKPSELTFYGALGIPLVLTAPVGFHEHYNRRWAVENGVGLKQREPGQDGYWIREWLAEGTLAAAWFGFVRLPKFGLYQVLEAVGAPAPAPPGV